MLAEFSQIELKARVKAKTLSYLMFTRVYKR